MKAAYYNRPGEVRVSDMPMPQIIKPTDAIVRVTLAGICGADLDFLSNGEGLGLEPGTRLGHEFVGIVEEVGADVKKVRPGDRVLSAFCFNDDDCHYCRSGLHTSCEHGGVFGSPFWGTHDGGVTEGAQAEYLRVPLADGTLFAVPEALASAEHDAKVLPLGDNFATGYHGAVTANVRPGGSVVVIGDGAIAQCAVQAATLFSPGVLAVVGHHQDRLALARTLGATHTINSKSEDASEIVRSITEGRGAESVIDSIGVNSTLAQSLELAKAGASVSVMGIRFFFEDVEAPYASMFMRNIRVFTGLCPAPSYIPRLLEIVEHGRIDPSVILTHTVGVEDAPLGYEIMNNRQEGSIKVAIRPGL